jgi:hypothetical protein
LILHKKIWDESHEPKPGNKWSTTS